MTPTNSYESIAHRSRRYRAWDVAFAVVLSALALLTMGVM